jgi:hypothetical protein
MLLWYFGILLKSSVVKDSLQVKTESSRVVERKEIACTHCVRSVISICVRELVEAVRVLEF